MAIVRKVVRVGDKPTREQVKRIKAAAKRPPVYDEENPPLTEAQLAQMARVVRKRKEEKRKPIISLRISQDTLKKAKATGRGYTGFLSRLLDNAINDPEMVKRSL